MTALRLQGVGKRFGGLQAVSPFDMSIEPGRITGLTGPNGAGKTTVVAHAVRAASPNPTREKIRDALTRTKDVPVVVGTGRYSYENRIPVYGSVFLQVKDGKFVPAP